MAVSTKRLRDIQRTMHLGLSAYLLAYLYSPLGDDPIAGVVTRVVIVPMLVVTGFGMWQLPRLRSRWERRAAGRRA